MHKINILVCIVDKLGKQATKLIWSRKNKGFGFSPIIIAAVTGRSIYNHWIAMGPTHNAGNPSIWVDPHEIQWLSPINATIVMAWDPFPMVIVTQFVKLGRYASKSKTLWFYLDHFSLWPCLSRLKTYPQYFSQHVPFWRQGHCFPQADWQPHGLYCRQGWSFLSVILFRIEWYAADFQVYFKRRTLPLLRKNLDLRLTSLLP